MKINATYTWKDRWYVCRAKWTTEEERLKLTCREWRKEVWLENDSKEYDIDAVFPPAKNDDYRNCDYFVFNGVCYGVGTEVRLKENQYFKKFRVKDYRFKRPNDCSKYRENYDYSKIDPIARFDGGTMNGIMLFTHVRRPDPTWGYKHNEYGDCEISAYLPEDYIEEIVTPVVVNRKIGSPSVIGNYKNLEKWKKADIESELWPQLLIAGLLLFGSIFTNAKEFWPMLICIIIYFAVWISVRANYR